LKKIDFCCGFASDPAAGACIAPPDSLAVFKGPTSTKRRDGKTEGREREGDGKRRGRKEREGPAPNILA